MMYGFWDMKYDRENFLSFWTIFCPFTSPNKPKYQHFEKTWRYYHFTTVYHKLQSYDVWFLRYRARQTKFFIILDHFLPFYSPNNLKNQNFEKMKIPPRDIITLHMCTINENRMMYGSWCMEHVTDRIFSRFGPFLVFYPPPPNNPKNQNLKKKMKKGLEILSFYTSLP